MKTFKRFLNEDKFDDIAESIVRDAEPFLREEQFAIKSPLWRGMDSNEVSSVKRVRKDRAPRNTPRYVHDRLDDYFLDNFGIRYRSNAMFALGTHYATYTYGRPYAVFPMGSYSYVWSADVDDLTVYVKRHDFQLWEYLEGGGDLSDYVKKKVDEMIRHALNTATYRENERLMTAVKKYPNHEIMVHCDSYIAVRKDVYEERVHHRLMELIG